MAVDPSLNPLNYDLTIGQLFPADDIVGQWVFTLNCVAQDIEVITWPLRDAQNLRAQMYFHRLLITRLYEARRLIEAQAAYEDIRDFTGTALSMTGFDLVAAYTRPADAQKSEVEQLYAASRHRTVHYPPVGSRELRRLLFEYHKFPAHLELEMDDETRAIDTQWVSVIRGQDSMGGAPWDSAILPKLHEFSAKTGAIASGWTMANVTLTVLYASRRGVSLERMIGDPQKLKAMRELHRQSLGGNADAPA